MLDELKELLKKHNAAIVRSADENHKLVLCNVGTGEHFEFEEDISVSAIEHQWYRYF